MSTSAQSLKEFLTSLQTDINNHSITAEEALAACQQYELLRTVLEKNAEDIASAMYAKDESLYRVLSDIIAGAQTSVSELPNFASSLPDNPKTEQDVRSTASLRTAAISRITKETERRLQPYSLKRREFIHDLVQRYSAFSPGVSDQTMAPQVDAALLEAAKGATTAQTRERFAELLAASEQISGGQLSVEQQSHLKQSIEQAIQSKHDIFQSATEALHSEYTTMKVVYSHLDLERPDVLVDVLLNAQQSDTQANVRAVKLAQVAETLEKQKGELGSSATFFSSDTAKGFSGGVQTATGSLLALFGEPFRASLYQQKAQKALSQLFTHTQEITDRFGQSFVKSALFSTITKNLSKSLGEKQQQNAGSVFGDVFSSVFRGPLEQPLLNGSKEKLLDYIELARANAVAPEGRSFLPDSLPPWVAFGSVRNNQQFSSGGIGRGGIFASFGSIVGGKIGETILSGFDKTVGLLFAGATIPQQLFFSRRAMASKTRLIDDLPLLISLVAISTIVLLYLLPTPLNAPQVGFGAKIATLFSSLYNLEGEQGSGSGSSVDCAKDPTNKLCTFTSCVGDCRWPTTGYISQGPNVSCNKIASHASGEDVNAVDFGANLKTPVYAIKAGTVISVNNTCKDNSGFIGNTCGKGYGNYIKIQFDSGDTVIYAHLSSAINPSIKEGSSVSAHQQIGWVDQTGNSTGSHLHFGVTSGGNVLNLLPDSPLSKAEILGCVSDTRCRLVGKGCPGGTVGP